ncbi:acetate--CoA ligase family protein [Candidatus Pacearchaeota archaeon]|nr:acetate--CoA ligase family protein [Candidatus Pacearchaeota archaeon]
MRVMTEKDAEDFLEKQGFSIVERMVVKTRQDIPKAARKIGFPVVLKLSSSSIIHKTELNAVAVDLKNTLGIANALRKMPKIKNAEFIVQKFVKGNELLIGLKKDAVFGHVLIFGSGGIYTEIFKDVSMRVLPANRKEIENMVRETRAFQLLIARGKKFNMQKLLDVLEKTAKLAAKHPEIKELDINPLIVNEKECLVVDARIVFN